MTTTTYADLRDASGLPFRDVTGERVRWYGAAGRVLARVERVVAVSGEPGQSQRLLDADGVSYWVAPLYLRIETVGADGMPRTWTGRARPRDAVATTFDATSEAWREYLLADGSRLRVEDPLAVAVREDGGHVVEAVGADPMEVPPDFVAVSWQARHSQPHFVR